MRDCAICKVCKYDAAFVGGREICRSCWLELNSEEKRLNILWPKKLKGDESHNDGDED